MAEELSYVLTTPYTLAKSRTGGVLSRLISRVDLELVGAQVFAPDLETTKTFAASLNTFKNVKKPGSAELLRNYVMSNMVPSEGRPHRVALFLFKGEEAVRQLCDIAGALYPENRSIESLTGETIRDTYADLLIAADGTVHYFEPAVLTPHTVEEALHNLEIFTGFMKGQDNIVHNMMYPNPEKIERTLVILKPDNWRVRSTKPGSIVDMLSRTGLRIVGLKVYQMSIAEALEFYGMVQKALEKSLAPLISIKAAELLEKEFNMKLDDKTRQEITEPFGIAHTREQFSRIVEFMSGYRPEEVPMEEWNNPGRVKSMLLVYEGENAVAKIREVLGPTDPSQAPGGTIRRDFGSDIMVNTAHASDSVSSAEREFKIVKIHENGLCDAFESFLKEQSSGT